MQGAKSVNKALEWIGLLFAATFLVLGIGLLTGFILPRGGFLEGGMRIVVGLVLMGYGIARATFIYRRLRGASNGGDDA